VPPQEGIPGWITKQYFDRIFEKESPRALANKVGLNRLLIKEPWRSRKIQARLTLGPWG
jgi:hypothetical protein